MKCPVCDNINTSAICPRCGFDVSLDYEHYPTLAPVKATRTVSVLRRQWQEESVVIPMSPKPERKKKKPWLIVAACAAMLVLGIGIGVGLGGGNAEPTEPEDTVQMQKPPETTLPPETTEPERIVTVITPQLTNILRSDVIPFGFKDFYHEYPVFGSSYLRKQIKSITFLDTLADMSSDAWDVSEAGNGKVMAWVKPNGALYDLYIGAEYGVWAGGSCEDLFAGYANMSEIIFGDAFHTENVQNMEGMFIDCDELTGLDLSRFDFANVTNTSYMFFNLDALIDLDLTSFDTANVRNMSYMFSNCYALTDLKLGDRFVTTNAVTTDMFDNCPAGDDYRHLLN